MSANARMFIACYSTCLARQLALGLPIEQATDRAIAEARVAVKHASGALSEY